MYMEGTQLRCLPLSLTSSTPPPPNLFSCPCGISLSSDGHASRSKRVEQKTEYFLSHIFLLIAKC